MELVDAHHHLWCPESDKLDIGYQWLRQIGTKRPFGDPTAIQRDYFVTEFLNETTEHKISASVHIQCDGAMPDAVKESLWLDQVSKQYRRPDAQIGFIDLTKNNTQSTLERYLKFKGIRGVRQILSRLDGRPEISFAAQHYLNNSLWQCQFALLAEYNLSFDLQCYPEQLATAYEIFTHHPDIPIVLDHAGSPYDQSLCGVMRWRAGLEQIAQLPHCHIKLSGFGMFNSNWDAASIQDLFDTIIELFGPQRVMFGSNFPVEKLMRDYDFVVNQIIKCAEKLGLDDAAQQQIFSQTARRFYRIT